MSEIITRRRQVTEADLSFMPASQRAFAAKRLSRPSLAAAQGSINSGKLKLKPVNRDLVHAVGKLIHERA